jgi:CubicO group peptidase (beta-lactamase class C family)
MIISSKLARRAVGIVFLVAGGFPGAATAAQGPADPPQAIAALDRQLPALMKDGDVPGLSIGLVWDGKPVWTRGFGVKNASSGEAVTEASVFEAASLSKPVFAYAVLKLADAGKLDLDRPLPEYLPGNYDVGPDARLGQVTARRVLSHTSGFPNWRPRGGALTIHFAPGERFSYSGEGFVYLAKVVERITGERTNDFVKRMVFQPLGMTSSSYLWDGPVVSQAVTRHDQLGKPTGQNKPSTENAAASLQTTAGDFGRFLAAVLNGEGLRPETRMQMLTPQVRLGESGTNSTDRAPEKLSKELGWGLGWGLQTTGDGVSIWHWGDNGDSKAYVVAFERTKRGIAVFTNSANGLGIMPEIVAAGLGGKHPALAWLKYDSYRSPSRNLLKRILAEGATPALREYRQWRKGRAPEEQISEAGVNQLGYALLRQAKREQDAIEVFKLNVEDYPLSSNAYDSLGEAHMVAGNRELAIANYRKSVELNPSNTGGIEALKKLGAEKRTAPAPQ